MRAGATHSNHVRAIKRYSVNEVCEITGMAHSSVRNAISSKRLTSEKDDLGRVVITAASLREWRKKSLKNTPRQFVKRQAENKTLSQMASYARSMSDLYSLLRSQHVKEFIDQHDYLKPSARKLMWSAMAEAAKAVSKLQALAASREAEVNPLLVN